jgi:hypothetical protein
MKLKLFITDDCSLCVDAELQIRKTLKDQVDNGEVEIVNLDQDEGAQESWIENDLPLAPIVVLMTDNGKVISTIEPDDLVSGMKEAKPADKSADNAAAKSIG